MLLLVGLWLLNAFDLMLTVTAQQLSGFNEGNPLGRLMLNHPYAVFAFKIGAVAFASAVLIVFRHHRLVELACWGICAVYVVLALIWMSFLWRYHESHPPRTPRSWTLPVKLERPPREQHRPVPGDVDQQPQGHTVDQ